MKVDGISVNLLNNENYKLKSNTNNTANFKLELEKAFDEQDKEKLKNVCSDFETEFMKIVYKQMKSTIPESEFMPKSLARETFEEMLEEEIISKSSKGQGMGLGEMLFKQLSVRMEKTYSPLNNNKNINKY